MSTKYTKLSHFDTDIFYLFDSAQVTHGQNILASSTDPWVNISTFSLVNEFFL